MRLITCWISAIHSAAPELACRGLRKPIRIAPLAILVMAIPACRPEGDSAATDPETTRASWSDQISAVRDGRSTQIVISRELIGDSQFRQVADGCERLTILEIQSIDSSEEALAVLLHCPQLQRLQLNLPVADSGAEHIAAATSLQVVNLPAARFTDDGLAAIAQLPRLELLRFHSPHVTDAGMTHIGGIESLRFLHLIDVPVSDAGLVPLHGMTGLESFYLDGGHCSDDGLRELLNALPELHFHKDQLHLPGDPRAHPHD